MVVRKPVEKIDLSDDDIDELISKGASVKEDIKNNDNKKKSTFLNLRIPKDMLSQINEVMKKRVGISRIGWILEAIHEKLEREK
jgi:hypothetical protein